jgi:hypothetical protein
MFINILDGNIGLYTKNQVIPQTSIIVGLYFLTSVNYNDIPLLAPFGGGGVACISRAAVSKAAIPNAYISIG